MNSVSVPGTDEAALRARLAEAEETLRAIAQGEVDALVVAGPEGDQIFTLKGAETPYRLLVEAMNEGALTLIDQGQILFCNSRFAQMVKKPLEKVAGSNWAHFIRPNERSAFNDLLQQAKSGGSKGEFTLALDDGSGVPVEVSVRAFRLEGIAGFSVLVTDITHRKQSEQELRQARDGLEVRVQERTAELTRANDLLRSEIAERTRVEEALKVAQTQLQQQARDLERQVTERTANLQATNKSLETICYNMAHDLRAPNRCMQGFAQLLLAEHAPALNPTAQEYLRRIATAAERNDRLILDMLTYGQLGHAPVPCSQQSLEAVFEVVLRNLSSDIDSQSAKIDIRQPLPRVWANPTALEQALTNLLSNALKFVARGVTPQISIWAEDRPTGVRLCLRDNGIGIPPEYQERVFGVFERLPEAAGYPGTGIGLPIVQKAVERMGGAVGVKSRHGEGSCFWIELRKAEGG